MSFGQRVTYRRKELGLTQTDLANKLGMASKSSVCRVERGYENNPTVDRIQEFAKALDTTYAYLMGLTDNPDPNLDFDAAVSRGQRDSDILNIISKLNDSNAQIVKDLAKSLLAAQK